MVVAARSAQPAQRVRRIGVLMGLAADDPESQARLAAFAQGLQQAGWTVGQNIRIDYRWGAGNADTMRKHAAELVARAPEVILAHSSAAVAPLLQASRTIPIVFTLVADPVGAGYVSNLARPGGNVTGFTNFEYSIGGKWLELLKEIAPNVKRVAVLRESFVASGPGQFGAIQAASHSLGVEVRPLDLRDAGEIERDITAFAQQDPDGGLIVTGSPAATVHRDLIYALALRHRLPWSSTRAFTCQRRPDFLWPRFRRPVQARRRLCRSDSQGPEPCDPAGAGADQVRTCRQPENRQRAGDRHPTRRAQPRRRCDRMKLA